MTTSNIRLLPGGLFKQALPLPAAYTSTYTLGSIANPARIIKFTSTGDADAVLSWDGVNDHEILPAGSFLLLDVSTNQVQGRQLYIPDGTLFYIKAASGASLGTKGFIYMSYYYV